MFAAHRPKLTFKGVFRASKVYYLDSTGTIFVVFGRLEKEKPLQPGTVAATTGVNASAQRCDS
jgi:hypothetical protein